MPTPSALVGPVHEHEGEEGVIVPTIVGEETRQSLRPLGAGRVTELLGGLGAATSLGHSSA